MRTCRSDWSARLGLSGQACMRAWPCARRRKSTSPWQRPRPRPHKGRQAGETCLTSHVASHLNSFRGVSPAVVNCRHGCTWTCGGDTEITMPRKRPNPTPEAAGSTLEPSKMKVGELKGELEKLGLEITGKKAELVARLEDALKGYL